MAVKVVMPKLGMAMKEGTVSIWNKGVGDFVKKGESIASVNSEKIEIEVESPAEGTVLKIAVPEGEGVPPGTVICYIGKAGEDIEEAELNHSQLIKTDKSSTMMTDERENGLQIQKSPKVRVKISPVARKIAEAANLNINKIQGTGPGGRITKEDVQEALRKVQVTTDDHKEKPDPVPSVEHKEEAQKVPLSGIRKVIADRMYNSLQTTAQLTINMKVDVSELIALQKQTAETIRINYDHKLTMTDFISRAVILSLQKHQEMNSAYLEDKIHLYKQIHLGMAVALEKGLVVPVIRQAENFSLLELSKKIKEVARKAREVKLSNEELTGSTFTISNLGSYGVEHFTPVLNPPESGILGVGAVYDTPIFKGQKFERRSILPLSLTFDHRVVDGAPAASFLQTVKQYLEEPITMLI